jgi:hypothetical protein
MRRCVLGVTISSGAETCDSKTSPVTVSTHSQPSKTVKARGSQVLGMPVGSKSWTASPASRFQTASGQFSPASSQAGSRGGEE